MFLAENIQVIQFIFALVIAFFFICSIVSSFKLSGTFVLHIRDKKCPKSVIVHIRNLYVANYESFHKYQIWRYFRLSL